MYNNMYIGIPEALNIFTCVCTVVRRKEWLVFYQVLEKIFQKIIKIEWSIQEWSNSDLG